MTVTVAKFVDEYAALSAFTGVPADEHRADDVAAGFRVSRRELRYQLPVTRFDAPMPDGLRTVPASRDIAEPLAHLDATLRRDVPGAEGWEFDLSDFVRQTFDDQFDPELYRIAMDGDQMVGLVRIWAGPRPVPRLGLIAVLAAYRRRGLARALLAEDFGVLADRGVQFVTTEADETNVASRTLLEGLGAQTTDVDVEMRRAA